MRKVGPFQILSDEERQKSLAAVLADVSEEFWLFAYGSLMWDTAFQEFNRMPAVLPGYKRSFCVWTAQARGTPERPGLGLGLRRERLSNCKALVIQFNLSTDRVALDAIWKREMWTGVYAPTWVTVQTLNGQRNAIAFVVDESHQQYSGDLPVKDAARHIAFAAGVFGSCRDYFFQTLATIDEEDNEFSQLNELIQKEINGNPELKNSG